MKSTLLTLGLLLFIGRSYAQFSELEKEFMQFEKTHTDSLTQSLYIDSTFCSNYNLKNITGKFKRMNVWNNPLNYDAKDFMRVCDIRWLFKDKFEAEAFHKKFLPVNSESGEEITNSKVYIENVTQLKIFRENAQARKMNEGFGLSMNFYYFIFIVDNCVAKVFVNTKTNVTVEQAAVFAKEAAKKIKNNIAN